MDISLVCVEDAILNIGFRKLTAYVKEKLNYDADVYFAAHGDNYRSLRHIVLGTWGQPPLNDDEHARRMAEPVAEADIVAFSSMTPFAPFTRKIISHVRTLNPDAFIVWGGIHPIVNPEDAIEHADAICTGEGEFAFEEFLNKFEGGKDFTDTKNFWFNRNGEIIRNSHRPLMSESEMNDLPLLNYGEGEQIYRESKGKYVPLTPEIYREYNGLGYNTIWSIGCPLHCTFCSNTKFIENNSDYTQVRHPSATYLVDEVQQALDVHPYISSVTIHDDSLMALHPDTLRKLGKEWKNRLDIPFTVMGVIPNYVTRERMEILLDAGMNRLRMGIQNGSEEILEFYKRPSPPDQVRKAANIINEYQDYMIAPSYDIIVDNPVETKKNVIENLELVRDLPRPFYLSLFSLRVLPNTRLEKQLKEEGVSICSIRDSTYNECAPTMANCLLYFISTVPVPDKIFETLLDYSEPADREQPLYPGLLIISRLLHLIRVTFYWLRFFEFTVIGKKTGYYLWKVGILDYLKQNATPDFPGNFQSQTKPTNTRTITSKTAEQ